MYYLQLSPYSLLKGPVLLLLSRLRNICHRRFMLSYPYFLFIGPLQDNIIDKHEMMTSCLFCVQHRGGSTKLLFLRPRVRYQSFKILSADNLSLAISFLPLHFIWFPSLLYKRWKQWGLHELDVLFELECMLESNLTYLRLYIYPIHYVTPVTLINYI